jgi:serine protease
VEQDAISDARAAGSIIVASAGNDGSALPVYPAAYMGVIGVSATTITKAVATYSNFGASVDIAAPGGDNGTDLNADGIGDGVVSTLAESAAGGGLQFGYAALNGTSMAAPHVSGVIALMKSAYPGLNPEQLDLALLAGDLTDDLGTPGRDDQYGYGFLNAQRAVLTALQLATGQGSDPGPIVSASASTLNFGAFTSDQPLTLQNVGTGTVQVLDITADETWVTVAPLSVDASGLGTYALTPNRSGLSDGVYTATLTVDTDANDLTVRLLMQVSSIDFQADAGLHYVILVDELGNTATPPVLVSANGGRYDFTINNVAAGQYRIFAGSDSDDDGFLCDRGEACGAYPTLDLPERISVNGDRSGLDFVSGFRVNLTTPSAKTLRGGDSGLPFPKISRSSPLEGDTARP